MKVFAHRKQTSTVLNDAQWPDQFVFPVQKVPATLMAALDKGIDLCNPKQRYIRAQPGPATGGEVDAACIQFDLGGETIPPPDLAAL